MRTSLHRADDHPTASVPSRWLSIRSRSVPEDDFLGVVDLVEMRALVWEGDAKGDVTMGASLRVQDIPADLADRPPVPRPAGRTVAESDEAHGEVLLRRGQADRRGDQARSAS